MVLHKSLFCANNDLIVSLNFHPRFLPQFWIFCLLIFFFWYRVSCNVGWLQRQETRWLGNFELLTLLPSLPKFWNYRSEPLHLGWRYNFISCYAILVKCKSLYICMYVCMCAGRSGINTSCLSLTIFYFLIFWDKVSLNLKLIYLARLGSQWPSGICCHPNTGGIGIRHCVFLCGFWESKLKSSGW